MSEPNGDWYAAGLRFACTRCGACCRGEGHVWVEPDEIDDIARFLGLEMEAFARLYLRRVGRRLSLVDKSDEDCVFWDGESGCRVYVVRPTQCRTFPFWRTHLASRSAWDEAARECPGMNSGPLHPGDEVRSILEAE